MTGQFDKPGGVSVGDWLLEMSNNLIGKAAAKTKEHEKAQAAAGPQPQMFMGQPVKQPVDPNTPGVTQAAAKSAPPQQASTDQLLSALLGAAPGGKGGKGGKIDLGAVASAAGGGGGKGTGGGGGGKGTGGGGGGGGGDEAPYAEPSKRSNVQVAMLGARAAAGDPMAMAELADEGVHRAKERMKVMAKEGVAAGDELIQAGGSQRAGYQAGHFFGAVEHAGAAVGGPFGEAIEKGGKFARMLTESVERLRDFNNMMLEGHFKFAEFSASMSMVQAQLEARQIMLAHERGERRAASAEKLADAKQRLDEALAPIEDQISNFFSEGLALFTDQLTNLIELAKITSPLLAWLSTKGQDDIDKGTEGLLNELNEVWEKYGAPQRFRPPAGRR